MSKQQKVSGFTLIELMIVVAVVAILAAIAYPSYQRYVLRTYRGQAKADLVEYAQMAERFHTANNTYTGFTLPVSVSPREATASTKRYNVVPTAAGATFTITATAVNAQVKDSCTSLTINQASAKTSTGDTAANCW
ncbi:type IV pilus assembly protein PilE [Pseudoxanthomonas sp. GM95]|uniref:type IV pilin protein n=1 Tax=Pseudoxanthomonas sp. GM95 TaxID=1881043 RepID=UPI0008D4707C|nr:type IV pilin protein [Pseudoxanthomonas sp. GM95]SEL74123.1 type IV pilus assembly protein PilE [Pseudoxanthomonas sp. GM95]